MQEVSGKFQFLIKAIASLEIGKSNWLKDGMLGSRRNSQSLESG